MLFISHRCPQYLELDVMAAARLVDSREFSRAAVAILTASAAAPDWGPALLFLRCLRFAKPSAFGDLDAPGVDESVLLAQKAGTESLEHARRFCMAMHERARALASPRGAAEGEAAPSPTLMHIAGYWLDVVGLDYAAAVELYMASAEAGCPWAQSDLAHCYQHGRGVPIDADRAETLYRLAADQGLPIAQSNLASLLLERVDAGRGQGGENEEALRLLQLSAASGNSAALAHLALLTGYGALGLPRNEREAERLLRQSAAQGDTNAMVELGLLLSGDVGSGAPLNMREAAKLWEWASVYNTEALYLYTSLRCRQ
eukprot:m51a1_g9495 hypothetical protein (315) ;mRNA; r:655714-657306